MTWLVLFPSGFYYVKKCERLHTELLITIKNIKRFFWHTKTQKKIREHLSPFLVWCMNFKRIFQIKTETSCFLRLYKNCEPLWQNSLFTKGWNHVRRSILFMNAKIKTIKKTPSVCHRIVQLQYIFLLFFYAFSCVHDCIFLSNSVGHDSLSSRLIWSVRVWLCTQFGGLMSSLGSRKPSFFFLWRRKSKWVDINSDTAIIFVCHMVRATARYFLNLSMPFVFMKTQMYWYVVFIQICVNSTT